MKSFLIISNKNLIEIEDLTLLGSSTKRGNEEKIGQFGSGWKYALATLMREDLTPIIYSGLEEIKIDTSITIHRNTPKEIITVNNEKTSITTSTGLEWNLWMAIREIISNAIDEEEFDYNIINIASKSEQLDFSNYQEENYSKVIIPMNSKLSNIIMNFDNYFSFDRKPYFRCKNFKIFKKKEKSETIIYRKGIRCYDSSNSSIYDFDFNNLNINESRLTTEDDIRIAIYKTILEDNIPYEYLDSIFESPSKEKVVKEIANNKEEESLIDNYFYSKIKQETLNNEYLKNYFIYKCKQKFDILPFTLKSFIGKFFTSGDKICFTSKFIYNNLIDLGFIKSKFKSDSNYPEGFINVKDEGNYYKILSILKKFNMDDVNIKNAAWVNEYSDIIYIFKDNCIYINTNSKYNNHKIKNLNSQELELYYLNLIISCYPSTKTFEKAKQILINKNN